MRITVGKECVSSWENALKLVGKKCVDKKPIHRVINKMIHKVGKKCVDNRASSSA